MRKLVAALFVVAALCAIASLALPWFQHEHTLGGVHVRTRLTLFQEDYCSNFARTSFECRTRSLGGESVLATLYPTFVFAARVTGFAAIAAALSSLLLIAFRDRADRVATITRVIAWCSASTLAMGTLVVLGRMPRDPRVEALELRHGAFFAAGAVLCLLVAWIISSRLSKRTIHPSTWGVALAALALAGSTMHPAWRQQSGDVGAREIGLFGERFCGAHRIGCSFRSFEPLDDAHETSRRESKRLGAVVFDVGVLSALGAWLTLGLAIADRQGRWSSSAAWLCGLGALGFVVMTSFFLAHHDYPRAYGIGIGALVGLVAAFGVIAGLVARVNNAEA